MLAEIFMLRLEAQSRANQPEWVDHDGERHLASFPITLPRR